MAARSLAAALLAAAALAAAPTGARAAPSDPLFIFTPVPAPLPAPAIPPPDGYLNGPCGAAVDASGNFYLADHYHDRVDVYDPNADYTTPPVYGSRGYLGQLSAPDPLDGPCGLALGSGGELYVNSYHRSVRAYGPAFGFAPGALFADPVHPTGIATDPASGEVYVDERTRVGVYEPSGAPVQEAGEPVRIGEGSLADGYGVALSAYPPTAGRLYVPDAASDTVKVYDPATDKEDPVAEIDASDSPEGEFVSLRDAAVAVDRVSGEIYVSDDLQPAHTESPHALVDVFDPTGAYEGHLKYEVVSGGPSGLAVDNSAQSTQGRVYLTSGNTYLGAVYAYPPGAATTAAPLVGPAPPAPFGGTSLFAVLEVGGTAGASGPQIACEGDSCQILPSPPEDPPLGSLVVGKGNPKVRYRHYAHGHKGQRGHGHKHSVASASAAGSAAAPGSDLAATQSGDAGKPREGAADGGAQPGAAPQVTPAPHTAALSPPPAGFEAHLWADGGQAAALAGSHPYGLDLSLGLDQGAGAAELRRLSFELPPGMLADPAATGICTEASFHTPRASPFEASAAGESCPARSQVGTIEAEGPGGEVRRFGLFELEAPEGAAARLGAAPFGAPLLFDIHFLEGSEGRVHLELDSSQVPQAPALHGLALSIWGAPWDASHNTERGNCLDEAEPSFPWSKCSAVEEPLSNPPLALLTLPSECGGTLAFSARAQAWSGAEVSEVALSREAGEPVTIEGCGSLDYEPRIEAGLTTKHVSSPTGFAFALASEDSGFINPRRRAEPRARSATIALPQGVTLNPSLGAGLEGCTPAQLAAASPTVQGCPNASKIGTVTMRLPFYKGEVKGALYLATPNDNPYGSLIAIYLVASAADRGIAIKARGKLTPDPAEGTLTAHLDGLTQLPYSELKVNFRSGQRAPLISPPSCGAAPIQIELDSWAALAAQKTIESPLQAGIEGAPCPTGVPPFNPTAGAGAINPNGGSYTPYFIHLTRADPEQEITSYSLVLPKGITAKLAGVPFCGDAAIAAARQKRGFAEAAEPSCPAASQIGRTLTGYGAGPSLSYTEGRVYLAGPYHGAPLSLVTINPATVGPFDLGTVVIRSAFDLDPRTAQLQIDSRASDPIPHVIDGVVLHVREIRVYADRPEFTHNPTSCEPSELSSTLTGSGQSFASSADDSTASVSERFQLLDCRTLGFRPRLGLRLRGRPRRGAFPALRASYVTRGGGDANLKRIEVDMPHQLFLAQNHIRSVCTREQFEAERCPPSSVYGKAAAYTPLLDQPLRGNVYLRSSSHKLPDLVAELRSGSIRIVVEGRIGPSGSGGIQAFFDDLPDAPIERFTMLLAGGRRGLLTNSVNVCKRAPLVAVKALGQNNVGASFSSLLRGRCNHPAQRSRHPGGRR